jgi:hypothetical protein
MKRLVEIWNSFDGAPPFGELKPVKKYTDRKTAVTRIWAAIQKLEPAPAPQQVAPKPAKKAKGAKAAADAPTPAPDASTPRVPRAFSKLAIVRDMLLRAIAGDCRHHGLAKTHRPGTHLDAAQEDGDRDHQHSARNRQGAGLRSREVASQQGSRQEPVAAAGEYGRPADQARPVLLADAGRKPSHAAAVREHGTADRDAGGGDRIAGGR